MKINNFDGKNITNDDGFKYNYERTLFQKRID